MRVIAGSLGGRQFAAPKGHRTHPMSDKVRGGLFNALGDVSGLSFLDAYGGSGAVGFEALSRGAHPVLALEHDRQASKIISENAELLGVSKAYKVVAASNTAWSDNNSEARFDIVVCDPPFDQIKLSALAKLSSHVKGGGLLIIHQPGQADVPQMSGFTLVTKKLYGDSQLVFYRRVA